MIVKDWKWGKFNCGFQFTWRMWIVGFVIQAGRDHNPFSPYGELLLGPLHLYAFWDRDRK